MGPDAALPNSGPVAGSVAPPDEAGAHLDRLHRAGRARLQRQADDEDDDARYEQRVRPEHEQPNPAQHIRRSADHRADGAADGGGGQLVTSGVVGLYADETAWDGDVADH